MNNKDIKAVLKLLACILIITYIADKLIYWQIDNICDKVYTGQSVGKLNHFLSVKDTMDVVVFGSSRANHHIDTKEIAEKSFNMGLDGKQIAYSATLIKTLPKNKKQIVIFHVDPIELFDPEYKGADIIHLNSKYHKIKEIAQEIDKTEQYNFLQKIYWTIDYNHKAIGIVRNYLKPQYDYKLYDGYDPISLNEKQKKIRDITLAAIDDLDCFDEYNSNKLSANYIEDVHEFCRTNNKKLVVITSPKHQYPCPSTSKRLTKFMEDRGIKHYNYINLFDKETNNDYWKDKTHLTSIGVEKFMQEFVNNMKNTLNDN